MSGYEQYNTAQRKELEEYAFSAQVQGLFQVRGFRVMP